MPGVFSLFVQRILVSDVFFAGDIAFFDASARAASTLIFIAKVQMKLDVVTFPPKRTVFFADAWTYVSFNNIAYISFRVRGADPVAAFEFRIDV